MGNKIFSGAASDKNLLPELCSRINSGAISNIVVMCGAGISTSAGIPDFRSPSTGLYFTLRKYNLPYPEAIFEISYFKKNPKPFYALVKELFPEKLTATDTHRFLALLHKKGVLRRVYTQNIDALEHIGGVPSEKVVEAHGTFHRAYCTKCDKQFSLKWLKDRIFQSGDESNVPLCDQCDAVVRPDIVFFGENLPRNFWSSIDSDFGACDLLLVFGTSLVVQPFCSLIAKTDSSVPRCFINLTPPGKTGLLGTIMGMGKNINFSRETDQIVLADCDKTVNQLVAQLGWEAEFNSLKNEEMVI